MAQWDPTIVKAQLRLAGQRLGQLQDRKDSQGQITRRDIATLLQQGKTELARAKAQNLIQDDTLAGLLGVLEMHVYFILEHFTELDQSACPSPAVVEAASSIIFASPQTQSKDLNNVRDLLIQRLGPDFGRSALDNRDNYVSPQVVHALSMRPPSVMKLDEYLHNIAKFYGVQWRPELRRQDILNPLSEILDPTSTAPIDLHHLQKLCAHGIPDEPPWLRPRIWKLFFGILPVSKTSWDSEIRKQRESYYDLVRRLLGPLSTLPAPTTSLASSDTAVLNAFKQLSRIPQSVLADLEDKPESSQLSPLDDMAPDDIKIHCASNLDSRLRVIRGIGTELPTPQSTPKICVEDHNDETPKISLSAPDLLPSGQREIPTILLPSNTYNGVSARQRHASTLLRLLYLHLCINPANDSPHLPSFLVPLYSVLLEEVELRDAAHVEADTFWLFEAMIGEFSELEEEEGANLWMQKFSERLLWADAELSMNLKAKGLDPALPHYSNRWLASLLTQTLPLSSVLLVWDALFSCPKGDRNTNPKLDYLLDLCTGMLIQARTALFRLGKLSRNSPGLWVEEDNGRASSPLHAWEVGDAFLEGISLLQLYPLEATGGIDRLLQTASDLAHRRAEEMKGSIKIENFSLSSRLKDTMWKSFTSHTTSDLHPDDDGSETASETASEAGQHRDDGNDDTEIPQVVVSSGITSRLATTVWRGITNQSSMDVPPSPISPLPPSPSSGVSPSLLSPSSAKTQEVISAPASPVSQSSATIWGYAEKLKGSDTAATLAKISTNWRAKAMLGKWSVTSPPSTPVSPPEPSSHSRIWSLSTGSVSKEDRRGSLPDMTRASIHSPPPRPVYFQPPQDNMLQPQNDLTISFPSSSPTSPQSDGVTQNKSIKTSLSNLRSVQTKGPRPLLLNSSSLITSPPTPSRSASSSAGLERTEWTEVMRSKAHTMHRDSVSSLSSLSPSDAFAKPFKSGSGPDWDSDSGRVVSLNRRSISPLAPGYRVTRRPDSASSSGASSDRVISPPPRGLPLDSPSPYRVGDNTGRTWPRPSVDLPKLSPSPNSPLAPPIAVHVPPSYHSTTSQRPRGTIITQDENVSPLEPSHSRKLVRKTPSTQYVVDDTSDSSVVQSLPKSPRTRSKKIPSRPTNLRLRENSRSAEQKTQTQNSLTPEWPEGHEVATTPRALSFDYDIPRSMSPASSPPRRRKMSAEGPESRPRKISTDGHDSRLRKLSTEGSRTRKISAEGKEAARRIRDSVADEGDDEGYDDLLSAYESEDAHH